MLQLESQGVGAALLVIWGQVGVKQLHRTPSTEGLLTPYSTKSTVRDVEYL